MDMCRLAMEQYNSSTILPVHDQPDSSPPMARTPHGQGNVGRDLGDTLGPLLVSSSDSTVFVR